MRISDWSSDVCSSDLERNRVHLAKMLLQGGNMLLLDEPTNDLDVETLRALEEAILDFPGNAMVISHDRWFLDRVATHILAFEDSGEAAWHEGNYRAYEDDFRRRTGSRSDAHTSELPSPMRTSYADLCLKQHKLISTSNPD